VIWVLSESERLSHRARKALTNPGTRRFVSVVSIWEILLKHQTGKLLANHDIDRVVDAIERQSSWTVLGMETQHLRTFSSMLRFDEHKDPFDRLLIAQGIHEGLDIVTADLQFAKYGVKVVW
jgi:PIN domain nuclease of toxin-antitoxin system